MSRDPRQASRPGLIQENRISIRTCASVIVRWARDGGIGCARDTSWDPLVMSHQGPLRQRSHAAHEENWEWSLGAEVRGTLGKQEMGGLGRDWEESRLSIRYRASVHFHT